MKKCSFCAEEIQDEAVKCRYCGSVLSPQEVVRPQQVEITNLKRGKTKILVGVFLLIFGLVFSGMGTQGDFSTMRILGDMMVLIGLVLLVFGKIENWYHSK